MSLGVCKGHEIEFLKKGNKGPAVHPWCPYTHYP